MQAERVRMYAVPFEDRRIRELISWYIGALQRAIDIIWDNITWRYDFKRYREGKITKVKVPVVPKSSRFKRELREELMEGNPYARHWVDAVIRTAYGMVESWRKRYIKGRARKRKPVVRRRFARCKVTLMGVDYERKAIRITIRPYEHVEVSYADAWFLDRVEGYEVGEVILKDDAVLIPFKRGEKREVKRVIGWDCNELTIDGFSPEIGFIHVDLRPLITTRINYYKKRRVLQRYIRKKRGRRKWEKYSHRERERCRDIERKIAVRVVSLFPDALHAFEELDKEGMLKHSRKNLRKRIARVSWRNIVKEIKQRTSVDEVDPKDTTRTCSRCGFVVKDLRGRVFRCPRCGLVIDRQKNASVNIYLEMKGFPHGYEWWEEVVKPLLDHELWVGVTQIGRMPMTRSPMKGGMMAMKPKRLVNLNPPPSINVHQP
ncbi:MAG: zinc ribbon domain-containing protein [Candidatus Methanospirareceae archaeon]